MVHHHYKGLRLQDHQGVDPVTTGTIFQIGSITKVFTATHVALKVDAGRMNWKGPMISPCQVRDE